MVSVALKISDEFKALIDKFPWINWSELAREELAKEIPKAEALEKVKQIVSKSTFTEKDALELGRKINKSLHKQYKKMYSELS